MLTLVRAESQLRPGAPLLRPPSAAQVRRAPPENRTLSRILSVASLSCHQGRHAPAPRR
jgi:hypothetical protein